VDHSTVRGHADLTTPLLVVVVVIIIVVIVVVIVVIVVIVVVVVVVVVIIVVVIIVVIVVVVIIVVIVVIVVIVIVVVIIVIIIIIIIVIVVRRDVDRPLTQAGERGQGQRLAWQAVGRMRLGVVDHPPEAFDEMLDVLGNRQIGCLARRHRRAKAEDGSRHQQKIQTFHLDNLQKVRVEPNHFPNRDYRIPVSKSLQDCIIAHIYCNSSVILTFYSTTSIFSAKF